MPTYETDMDAQVAFAKSKKGDGDLLDLYLSSDIWKVGGDGKVPEERDELKKQVCS